MFVENNRLNFRYDFHSIPREGKAMFVNVSNIVPVSRASRNFSEVAHLAEKTGEVWLFKNNRPKFRLVDVESRPEIEMTDAEKIEFVARRILRRHRRAFLELAK